MDSGQSISETSGRTAGIQIGSSVSLEHAIRLVDVQKRLEPRVLTQEGEFYDSSRTVPLLGDDQFGEAGIFFRRFVDLFAIDEHHEVGVLFNRTRFTQVRKLRLVIALTLFGSTAQLGKRDHRDVQLFGKRFQSTGYP